MCLLNYILLISACLVVILYHVTLSALKPSIGSYSRLAHPVTPSVCLSSASSLAFGKRSVYIVLAPFSLLGSNIEKKRNLKNFSTFSSSCSKSLACSFVYLGQVSPSANIKSQSYTATPNSPLSEPNRVWSLSLRVPPTAI